MTQRTKADLDTLFADNTTKQITPSRLRDFLESCVPSAGGIHFHDPGTVTVISAPATFVKAANTSELHPPTNRFSMPADNRLRYDGVVPVLARMIATLSFFTAANNQICHFALYINGVQVVPSRVRTKVASGGDIQAVTIMACETLNPGDFVEVWLANDTSASNITVDHGHLVATTFLQ